MNPMKKRVYLTSIASTLLILLSLVLQLMPNPVVYAAHSPAMAAATSPLTISVFEDQNANAIREGSEQGVGAVTIRLFDANDLVGTPCAGAATDGTGEVTFTPVATSACEGDLLRMEVDTTTFPAGLLTGPVNLVDDDANPATSTFRDAADDAGPTVQMVDLSSPVTLNVGVINPLTYQCSPENASALTTCFVNGDPLPVGSLSGGIDALVGFPYTAQGSAFPNAAGAPVVEPNHLATAKDIGSAWGIAWSQQTEQIYTAAFLKRHIGLGPLGLDGIYRVDVSTGTPLIENWLEVENDLVVDVGESVVPLNLNRDLSSTSLTAPSRDSEVYPLIGTVGFGDIDLVTDEAIDPPGLVNDSWIDREFLFLTDLKNKDVLVIDPDTKELVTTYDIPDPTCANGEHRPWALDYNNGTLYVGLVCDGSSDISNIDAFEPNSNLEAIVYSYDLTVDLGAVTIPATPTVTPQTLIRFALDYEKGTVWDTDKCAEESNWHPWRTDVPPTGYAAPNPTNPSGPDDYRVICWPTPVLVDIDFSDDGNMLLAFMDRSSHQWGWINESPDLNDPYNEYNNMSGGDILMACPDGTGNYVLESNGQCGNLTSANSTTFNEGPGGKEFFFGDAWRVETNPFGHHETANNGIAVLPGSNEVILAGMDPYNNVYNAAGGINWFSTIDGTPRNPGYMLYVTTGADRINGTQGKAGGLGDVDLFCPQIPVTIGDYVWYDADGDGLQDPDELPLAGVTVYLTLANGAVVTTTTDANGYYNFEASRNQTYMLAFDVSTMTTTLPNGLTASNLLATTSNSTTASDENDSDLTTTMQVDTGLQFPLTLPALAVTTDRTGASNHSGDAGFGAPEYDLAQIQTLAPDQSTIVEANTPINFEIKVVNQGNVDSGSFVVTEQIPAGMSLVSVSGIDWTTTAVAGATGAFEINFNGNLVPGEMTVLSLVLQVDDPSQGDFRSWSEISSDSSGEFGLTDDDSTPNANTGNDDGPGVIGTPPDDAVDNHNDITLDQPVGDEDDNDYEDVTIVSTVSLGNLVWIDLNNNGLYEPLDGETGIGSVMVELYDDAGTFITSTVTSSTGEYLFENLDPGVYQVQIPTPPAAFPLSSSGAVETDNQQDNDDNGIQPGGVGTIVTSPLIDLQPGAELGNDGDNDASSDLTIDFGFWAPAPAIQIEKTVYQGHDGGAQCPGNELVTGLQGEQVTYCFVITNTGNTYLNGITITDNTLSISRADMTLIPGSVEPLAPRASMTFYFETTMNGNLVNTASTSGNPTDESGNDIPNLDNPTDSDDAQVEQIGPGIRLEKTVYAGHDNGVSCPGLELVSGLLGDDVTYCFVVTNTGDTYLADIRLSDTDLGIIRSDMGLISGVEPLAPGASMIFFYQTTISGNLLNRASTSGNPVEQNGADIPGLTDPTDDDTAEVNQVAPAIDLEKTVYAGHNSGTSCPGTELVSGAQGDAITYCFVVTNTGTTYLNAVQLTDVTLEISRDDMTLLSGSEPLAPNATLVFYIEMLMDGSLVNVAETSANPVDENGTDIPNLADPIDTNDAQVQQSGPGIRLAKTVYLGHTGGAGCPGEEVVQSPLNGAATYCFVVTNTGDTYLNDITLSDPQLNIGQDDMTLLSGAQPLAPNASIIFYYETTISGQLLNIATTSGNPTDENGNDIPNLTNPTDSDDAEVKVPASLGNYVWFDTNGNGIQEQGEEGIANVTVTLFDENGSVISVTLTDQNGLYLFPNLEPGTYSVGVELPGSGFQFSPQNAFADDEFDSDVNPLNGRTDNTQLSANENDLSWDAGINAPPVLIINKTANVSEILPNGTIIYTLDYANTGIGDATNVVITERIPLYTTFQPDLSSPGWRCENDAVTSGITCTFTIPLIPGQSTGQIQLSFVVVTDAQLPDDLTIIENQVTIEDDGTHGQSTAGQANDNVTVEVIRPTGLDTSDEPQGSLQFLYLPLLIE